MVKRSKLITVLAFLAMAFLTLSCTNCASTIPDPLTNHKYTSEVSNMAQSVVAVLRITDNRIRLVGSAVVIRCEAGKPIRLLTAQHVPEAIEERDGQSNPPILIGNTGTKRFQQVKVVVSKPGWDLAVLEGFVPEENSCPSVSISKTLPEIGSFVWLVGNPLGHEKNITHGILSHVYFTEFFKDKPLVYRSDAAAGPGNSGGGLFNNRGELIGILSFGEIVGFGSFLPGGGHSVALPMIWVLLKDLS
jgi:S1-C subfamily serine protease